MTHAVRFFWKLLLLATVLPALLNGADAAGVSLKTLAGTFEVSAHSPWSIPAGQSQASRTLAAPSGQTWDFRGASKLSVLAERVNAFGGAVRLRWLVYSRVGGLYLGPAAALPLSGRATVSVSFAGNSGELTPVGHQRPWDALAAADVTSLELRAECSAPALGNGDTDKLDVSLATLRLDAASTAAAAREVLDIRRQPAPPGSAAACVLSFRINPMPDDPYAPTGPGDVRVKLASGKQALAFLDQDFVEIDDGGAVRLAPIGLPVWRAYLPEWPAGGSIEIVSGDDAWKIPCGSVNLETPSANSSAPETSEPRSAQAPFDSQPAPKALARLRWETPLEAAAPLLEPNWTGTNLLWTLGAPGYWIPISLRDYVDLYSPHALSPRVSSEDHPRVNALDLAHKSVWRPVPFWNQAWGGYAGARRPDSALARRMDALLESAARDRDVRPMVLFDGASLERQGVFNWAGHPLRGALAGPGEIFRTEEGFDFCARWMRYCLARYAHSTAVGALLITTDLNAPGATEFHARIAPLLKSWRAASLANKPIVSTHPLAQPAQVVKEMDTFQVNHRRDTTAWHVDRRLARAFGRAVEGVGWNGAECYEIGSQDAAATSLAMQRNYEREVSVWRVPDSDNFTACDALMFEVWTPPDAPHDLRVGVHLRDRNGNWYQTLLPGMIRPGDWTTFALDLTAKNAHGLTAIKHRGVWTDYSRQRIQEIGLHVYSTHPSWKIKSGQIQNLTARFENIRGVVFPQTAPEPPPRIALYDPAAQAIRAPDSKQAGETPAVQSFARGSLVELHVKVSKTFANPFDARDCDLVAVIKTPSGKTVRVPAFFNQLCDRREAEPGGDEIVEAFGEEFFTVRYRAQETGPHSVKFELREGGKYNVARAWVADPHFTPEGDGQTGYERQWPHVQYPRDFDDGRRPIDTLTFVPGAVTASLDLGAAAFAVVPSDKPFHGFVRVAKDQRHFEFDDGTFFYPIGPCLRSPSDTRVPYDSPKFRRDAIDAMGKRGTYQYDEYFAAFGKAGINWARMWMCSWWGALEWRRDWPGYQGLGRYNLLNAWRVDYVLDLAEKNNIHLNLAITNHGQFTLNIDTEWANNPYNAALGGPIHAPCEIFTRAEAKIAHRNKLRYIAARYGHSPAVMAFALFSELEFTEEYEASLNRGQRFGQDYPAPNIENWHVEMATYLKNMDPNRHLVTTHFSHPVRGEGTLKLPQIDFATSNAYSAFDELGNGLCDAGAALHDFWMGNENGTLKGFHIFDKPSLVEEQGRHWMGMDGGRETNTKVQLDADLHAGLWGSMAVPLGGATGYWWWLHVHFDNRYGEYRALAKFMEGEDFRPIGDEPPLKPVFKSVGNSQLLGRAMKSDRRMYIWIYNQLTPFGEGEIEDTAGAKLNIGGLIPGKYVVEFWDTYKGEKTDSLQIEVPKEKVNVSVPLPVVRRDIAVKIKPK